MIYLVFLVSGFSALLYQIVWQRSLFALFGINIESVTLIVTAFMLGLGLGSLAGGHLSKRTTKPLLAFGLIEGAIGAFGLVSLPLFRGIGDWLVDATPGAIAVVTFGLVLVPTLLMGATLPLLVGYRVQLSGNVGRSVGVLYFVNTAGSAVAAFAAPIVLFGALGQGATVRVAASLNLVVCLGAIAVHSLTKRSS